MKKFFSSLFGSKPQKLSLTRDSRGKPVSADLQVAVAGVLIEVAGIDRQIDQREVQLVCEILVEAFAVSEDQVDERVETAIKFRKAKGTADQFIETVKSTYSTPQLVRVLSMVWRLVGADSRVTSEEFKFANDLKFRLGLSAEQAEAAQAIAGEATKS